MPVADLMTDPLVTIQHDTTVATAWTIMRERQIRHLPVLDDHRRLIGMLTDHDLRRVVLQHLEAAGPEELRATLARLWVDEVMTWAVVTVTPERDIRDAARMMRDYEVGALAVVSEDRVVGILTATDVIEALLGSAV
ncbi:MAG TPA: CBS domain-containing protein [Methylomirabilota bacterium]|nr:CBS domain-containing protein [Methylomirabilota bacterium]